MHEFQYDIAISFAGEDRGYVKSLVRELEKRNLRVFYDKTEESTLWGKDLYEHLSDVYSKQAVFCIMVLSDKYVTKNWTRLEKRAAQARAFEENEDYILPLRLDDTAVPGLLSTTGYIDANSRPIEKIADLVLEKIKSKYLESLNEDPELMFKTNKNSAFLLLSTLSKNLHLTNKACACIHGVVVTNKSKRVLSIEGIHLKIIEPNGKKHDAPLTRPRLSMLEFEKKVPFPTEGELILKCLNENKIIIQGWKDAGKVLREKSTLHPGESIRFSLFFIFKTDFIHIMQGSKLRLEVEDSWECRHTFDISDETLGSFVHDHTKYLDAYAIFDSKRNVEVIYDFEEYLAT